ncbi:MAG TPA: hypothetical protein PLO23_01275 [Alphaproteobacteria bacterium]|nr:hypothetical protein [Alphaproteobacteria bacterium]
MKKNILWDNLVPLVITTPLIFGSALSSIFDLAASKNVPDGAILALPLWADPLWPKRALTAGEMVLASRFFGPGISLGNVNLYDGGERPEGFRAGAQAFNPLDMAFYGVRHYSSDYSVETEPWKFGAFFHEIAHLDHHRLKAFTNANFSGECLRKYEYVLVAGKKYDGYCIEQQATLVEDYARRFLMDIPAPYRHGNLDESSDALLAIVVEARYPGAAVLRAEASERRHARLQRALENLLPTIEVITTQPDSDMNITPDPELNPSEPTLAPAP